jgi:hypothetical protein
MKMTKERSIGDLKERILEDLAFLRGYARQTILQANPPTDIKYLYIREDLIGEFMALGRSFALTERDLVVLLYRELFDKCP